MPPLAAGALVYCNIFVIAEFSLFNSRRVQSHDCDSVIYRNPSSNGFFLLAGSPCGKRSKPVEIDQWITGYSMSGITSGNPAPIPRTENPAAIQKIIFNPMYS